MSRAESTITKAIAVVLAASAVAAAPAAAQQDLRSPDHQGTSVATVQDLRSPDARDAVGVPPSPTQRGFRDLVSPDARDSAREFVTLPAPSPSPAEGRGFQWDDAGIGAGVVAALLAAGLAGVTLRRRHDHPGARAVTG
jgi:hypothetical protein